MSSITIPPRIVGYAHESLCRRMGFAAGDIAQISEAGEYKRGELYAEPLRTFDRNRELLDTIGWTPGDVDQPVTITTARHCATLRQALRAQLEIEREMMEEDLKMIGSVEQIEKAKRAAREIEQFLVEVRESLRSEG